jgi:hypothetical protein
MSDNLDLTVEEVEIIVTALRYSNNTINLQEKLLTYIGSYIPKQGILAKNAFVVAKKWGSEETDPLNYKVEINQVTDVKDYDENKVECIRKRQYYHPLKSDIFGTRVEAKLAGYKKHVNLFNTVSSSYIKKHQKKIDEKLRKLKRQIYLIESFPEKHI